MASLVWTQLVNKEGKKSGNPFMVPPGINVADFKKKVKEEMKPELDWLAANHLEVYKNEACFKSKEKMEFDASLDGLGVDDENVVWVVVPDALPATKASSSFIRVLFYSNMLKQLVVQLLYILET